MVVMLGVGVLLCTRKYKGLREIDLYQLSEGQITDFNLIG